ncbi:Lysosomal beta glucosidase [Pyrus ussuriensis x Pyrus communis]|uniref:Lysosomal beta glucosidase n=1 Tax=Pyrus ussuriensis x Pyrus communis TaxID=2448454 RepID=A0A5N5I6A7_9ROSA|nr:Lysosomal beta glucosidase [Pyrus ussuriensis x Pyrus communis]
MYHEQQARNSTQLNKIMNRFRDADLAERIGAATALEVRASGIQYTFSPCVAVCRDPRWGRCYESFREDTEIVRKMTTVVTGLQGQPRKGRPKGYPFVMGRVLLFLTGNHLTDFAHLEVMVPFRYEQFVDDLVCLVEHGEIPMSRIDDAVERILRVKFVADLFEHPLSVRSC